MGENANGLPPGFRFYPTDEELVVHFLHRKAALLPCHPDVIPDLDLYHYDPWDLDGKALAEGKQWYFYSRRSHNRVTENGYWKPIGTDEPILSGANNNRRVGMKRYLMFFVGEVKTNWVMEEYRLPDSSSATTTSSSSSSSSRSSRSTRSRSRMDCRKWVICRVYESDYGDDGDDGNGSTELSCLDEVFLSLDDLDEISLPN